MNFIRQMKVVCIGIILSILSACSIAGEMIIHTVSIHSGQTKYKNQNWGLGYKSDDGYVIGTYRNSYDRNTVYAGREFMYNDFVGALVVLTTGYEHVFGNRIQPSAFAVLRMPIDKHNVTLIGIPKVNEKTDAVLHLTIGIKF